MSASSSVLHRPALRLWTGQSSYSISLARSIDERDADEWRAACGGRVDWAMDPRFLRVVEKSMADQARFYNVVVRDAAGTPAAAAFLSVCTVDGLLLAGAWKKAVAWVRLLWPRFLKVPVLLCGCPISTADSNLRITASADPHAVLRELDQLLMRLARREGAYFIALKEFGPAQAAQTDGLPALGYIRADSLPTNKLPAHFHDYADMVASFRCHYRQLVLHAQKKFARSGLRVVHRRGGVGVEALFTDDVYRLYLAVYNRAKVKFERLPPAFFHELARQFPDDASFTLIYQDQRIVGFTCGLFHQDEFVSFVCGLDYTLNADAELYFNLLGEDFDYVLRQGVHAIHVGQTTDEIKAHMGCFLEPRWFYVKARPAALHELLRALSPRLFPPAAPIHKHRVFRDVPAGGGC